MKFLKYYNEIINEVKSGIDVTALKKGSKKEAGPKDEIGTLVAKLEGGTAQKATKFAKKLQELNDEKNELDAKLKKAKEEAEKLDLEVFDPSDLIYSRILETAKQEIRFAKIVDQAATTKKSIASVNAVEDAFEQIEKLLLEQNIDLKKQINKIKKSVFKIEKIAAKPGIRKLPNVKMKESVSDTINKGVEYLKGLFNKVKESFKSWLASFDDRSDEIDDLLDEVESKL